MAKSPTYYRCLQQLQSMSRGQMSEDELADQAEAMEQRARQLRTLRQGTSAAESVNQAMAEQSEEELTKGKLAKRAQYLMATTFSKAYQYVTDVWREDPRKGYEAYMVGSTIARRGARNSVLAAQISKLAERINGFHSELEASGLIDVYKSGAHDLDAYKALDQMYKDNQDMSGIHRDARRLAEIVYKYQEAARVDLNNAGAWIKRDPDYIAHQNHDMFAVRRALYETTHSDKGWAQRTMQGQSWADFFNTSKEANYKAWRDHVKPLLDEVKTYKGVKPEDNEAFLRKVWENIASGNHLKADSAQTGFSMPSSLARKLSEPRILHFKDAESRFKYDQMFGRGGNLLERASDQIAQSARASELMRAMGPNPEIQHQRMKQAIYQTTQDTAAARSSFSWKRDERHLDAYFSMLSGEAHIPGMDPLSSVLRMMRFTNVFSKLGMMVFSSATDMAAIERELSYQGIKGLANWREQGNILVRGYGKRGEERAGRLRMASELGVTVDMLSKGTLSQFVASDSLPGTMSRLQHIYMTLNQGLWWTDMKRVGLAAATSHHLASLADHPFSALPPETLRLLKIYDIKEPEWDLMRTRAVSTLEGKAFFSPKGARDITDPEISSLLEGEGLKPSPLRIRDRREDIEQKFRVLHATRGAQGVMHADAQAQMRIQGLNWGAKAGEATGELMKSFSQFKSFPAAIIEKVWGRELYGYGEDLKTSPRQLWNATKQGGGLLGLTKFMAYATFLGYISLQMKAYLAGKVLNAPRNQDDFERQFKAAWLQGGGGGIFADFIMGNAKDRFGHGVLDDVMGPVFGQASDLYELIHGAGTEVPSGTDTEFKAIHRGDAAAAKRWQMVRQNLPLANLWYLKAAMDRLVLFRLQEDMSPGSLARMEKSMRDEMNTTFRVPATKPIASWGSEDYRKFVSPSGE